MGLQQRIKQLCVGAGLGVAALALTACGGGSSGRGGGVVILVHNGYWGYYDGVEFCDALNSYCNTSLAYGISDNGLYYNGQYVSGTTSTGGGVTSTGGGTTSTGGGVTSTGGGTTSTGGGVTSTGGGTTSTGGGTTSTGGGVTSTGGGTTSTGGGVTSTGGGTTSTGGYTYSTGSGATSTGGGVTSTGGGTTSTGGTTSSGYTNTTTGIENSTTDTGMMQAMVNMADVNAQANQMVTEFPISFEAARQLVQLQDKMQILQQNQELTGADQQALASAALSVGKVSHKDVVNALAQYANGNKNALTNVELKYAKGIGLPQSYLPMVRDQILPRLGVTLPNN